MVVAVVSAGLVARHAAGGHPEHEGHVDVVADGLRGVSRRDNAGREEDSRRVLVVVSVSFVIMRVVRAVRAGHIMRGGDARHPALAQGEATHVLDSALPGGVESGVHGGGVGHGEGGGTGQGVSPSQLWPDQVGWSVGGRAVVGGQHLK